MSGVEMRILVGRVKWTAPDGSWIICQGTRDSGEGAYSGAECPIIDSDPFAVTGPLGFVIEGDVVDVAGDWERHARYGWQFKAQRALPAINASDYAFMHWLQKFPNVGPRRAQTILKHFDGKENVAKVLETEPQRLAEISGITAARAAEIAEAYVETAGMREQIFFVAELDVGARAENDILRELGKRTKLEVEDDPYVLMTCGIPFHKVDKLALGKLKMKPDDDRRLAAVAAHALKQAAAEGHVWSTIDQLMKILTKNK